MELSSSTHQLHFLLFKIPMCLFLMETSSCHMWCLEYLVFDHVEFFNSWDATFLEMILHRELVYTLSWLEHAHFITQSQHGAIYISCTFVGPWMLCRLILIWSQGLKAITKCFIHPHRFTNPRDMFFSSWVVSLLQQGHSMWEELPASRGWLW